MTEIKKQIELLETEIEANERFADIEINKIMGELRNKNIEKRVRIKQLKQLEELINE